MMHTPGPWKAQGGKVTNRTGSHFIADFGTLANGPNPEVEANANLGAAAPDMRDALKRCTELLASAIGLPPKEVATALTVANLALAKAEGLGREL